MDTVIRFPHEVHELFHVPEGNKLYVSAYVRDPEDYHIYVLDCSDLSVRAVIPTGAQFAPRRVAWCPRHNKVYLTAPALGSARLLVVDNATDSVVERLEVEAFHHGIAYSSSADKLYAVGVWGTITVLDCDSDTVLATIVPPDYTPCFIALWDSIGDKVYVGCAGWTNTDWVSVVDCTTDSVVTVIRTGIGWPCVGVYNPLRRKVYLGGDGVYGVCAIDCTGDTVVARFDSIWPSDYQWPVYCSVEDKLYWPTPQGPPDTIYVIDSESDSVVRRIPAPGGRAVYGVAYAEWINRLYVASGVPYSNQLTVLDCRTDMVIGQTRFGNSNSAALEIICNPADQRIYVSVMWDSAVYVFRDQLQPVEEQPGHGHRATGIRVWPNPARDRVWLGDSGLAMLYSANGRLACCLEPGPNDVSHLAPGVYFPRSAVGREPSAVQKVVVQR